MSCFRGVVVAALLALIATPAAFAHGGGGTDYSSKIRSVTPAVPGLRVHVLDRDDRLELRNRSGRTVVVEGYSREPYIRLSGDGTVEVNRRSPALYLNEDRLGATDVPASADERAAPRWKRVSGSGRFTWHDHRIHWMGAKRPDQVRELGARTKIFDWKVPMRVGARRGEVAGTLFWAGRPGQSFPLGAGIGLAVAILGGLALVVFVRRGRRRSSGAASQPEREAW
jgi:hypothetical protein